ncbi:hypothetical protein KSC_023330 [Ktedonobacter sp. SOSP1-52]|uniref:hypothetical protein n=1 Tax=Ktedonobacter sp. SOSP1-52 TaxID=2778366 RepID=UPI001915F9CB|nr:hypothetical protein [Ktedonobacter sp. SOSP1-52]GHO63441.1 hypothetical protein KSC_023330 [Ktedonobacter sp. SOSP1-52]
MDNSPHQLEKPRENDSLPETLQHIAHFYAAQPVPHPSAQATQNIMDRLLREETARMRTTLHWHSSPWQILRIARWQMVLLGPVFWILGVLLFAMCFLIAPFLRGQDIANLLIILLPFAPLVGIIHALRTLALRTHEVEASCATNIIEITAALALAIVGFDILLGMIATVALALLNFAPFVALLLTWLGPLLLLTGISLPVALRWGTLPALLIAGVPWLLLVTAAYMSQSPALDHVSLVSQNTTHLAFCGLCALIGLLLLLLLFLRGSNWQQYLLHYS